VLDRWNPVIHVLFLIKAYDPLPAPLSERTTVLRQAPQSLHGKSGGEMPPAALALQVQIEIPSNVLVK
jgi:hypothetical protein